MTAQYKEDANFVWTDLSSYDTKASRKFYEEVFGWRSYDMGAMAAEPGDRFGMDQVNYHIATIEDQPVAGIFDMPPFFKTINMPPFWMSYLSVTDLNAVVQRAKAIEGVVIDVEPTPFGEGMMALIRDPRGAGFTCYEGPSIASKGDGGRYGRMVWNELITESVAVVETFYKEVLGFKLEADREFPGTRLKVFNPAGEEVAGIQELAADIRGDKVYWLPFFSVDAIAPFTDRVQGAGGELIGSLSSGGSDGSEASMYFDNTGAAFAAVATGADAPSRKPWYSRLF